MPTAVRFELPAWPEESASEWESLSRRARSLVGKVGAGPGYSDELELVRTLIDRQDFVGIEQRIPSMRFARALASVWAHEPERAWRSMHPSLVLGLIHTRPQAPSRLLLLTIAQVFFTYFDQLDQPRSGVVEAVRQTLLDGLQMRTGLTSSGLGDALGALADRAHQLLHPASLSVLAGEIAASGVGLHDWLHHAGLEIFDIGRFAERLRQETYLRRLEAADPASPDGLDFLAELTEKQVYHAPGTEGWYFGHQILQALALRPDAPPCDLWMDTLLAIGEDPRLRHTASWRSWWEPLGEQVQRAAIRWLSLEDLELFLDAIEQFGEDGDRDEIKRMFPSRSTFLRGLHRNNLVVETRLVLGDRIRAGVQRHLGNRRADLSRLSDNPSLAVIIVDCGFFYFVEGSHNFKWGIFAGTTPDRLLNRSVRNYTRDELYEQVVREHDARHPLGADAREWQTHQGYWAVRAWRFIVERLGIELDGRAVLDKKSYYWAKYDSSEGMPVVGHRLLRWWDAIT